MRLKVILLFIVFVSGALFPDLSYAALPKPSQTKGVRVKITIQNNFQYSALVKSYLTKELNALDDMVVVDHNPAYNIIINGLDVKSDDSIHNSKVAINYMIIDRNNPTALIDVLSSLGTFRPQNQYDENYFEYDLALVKVSLTIPMLEAFKDTMSWDHYLSNIEIYDSKDLKPLAASIASKLAEMHTEWINKLFK